MSTKIGIIAEGPIDSVLLAPLLSRIAEDLASFQWPVTPDEVADVFHVRKRGHGGVLETVRALVSALDTQYFDHAFFVILLDRRTAPAQAEIKKLIRGKHRFVLGIAMEEIEAWWLGDRTNTLQWSGLKDSLPQTCRYAARRYQAERDEDPKKTLDELTRVSNRFDRCYGQGNVDLASEFAEDYWRRFARLNEIATQCPKGFAPFQKEVFVQFQRAKVVSSRLFR